MFERLLERALELAEERAERRVQEIADRALAELPSGITAAAQRDGVVLSGRALSRRFALEPALRWMRFR
ncbi:MAG: hypothetical protein AVDCRST_MAG91-705 [uncultured Sphingomonadaceae bacterium]|uniref:Uncharacterized protein n=1 Tax=uncultured Sphingomonadaceae bacterium TaxID=169976 RepID=A0A6J4SHG1_9SPHN|nr:MAG: hypothetical protein AVDCRST_MAG91-705 [uncultured Sphingomonadaceae bacterium]